MASYGGQASDGMRAARHAKARQIEIEDAELRKRKLADSLKVSNIENKFSTHYDAVEQEIKASTVRHFKLKLPSVTSLVVGWFGYS